MTSAIAKSKVHFIGIGGIGMSGIAELLLNMGATVSGSDQADGLQTRHLRALGATVYKGHSAENVLDVDVVVYSSAIQPSNPEYKTAMERKIPLIGRAEALAEVMRLKRGVAIAGTHGKTTTTSLTAQAFLSTDLDPTIVVGGRLDLIKSNAKLGAGEWLIAEADESDGSFLRLSPEISVITNLDLDHLDFYKSEQALADCFREFADRVPFYGLLVACGDEARTRKALEGYKKPLVYYGFESHNDYVLKGEKSKYVVLKDGQEVAQLNMPMPGKHNALNALAAMIVSQRVGIDFQQSANAISKFAGVDRRFQFKGEIHGVNYYDDYGHHPTEIEAVLEAMREKYGDKKIHVVFQPHRYSRTAHTWDEFQRCFEKADYLYLLDIYAAGEEPVSGITSSELLKTVQGPERIPVPGTDVEKIVSGLIQEKKWQPGDIVLTLGAGNVSRMGDLLRKEMAE